MHLSCNTSDKAVIRVNTIINVCEFVIKPLISEVCCCVWNFLIKIRDRCCHKKSTLLGRGGKAEEINRSANSKLIELFSNTA